MKKELKAQLLKKVKKFDPFDKIQYSKSIDNQILTSYRTLTKENNFLSNTLKIIHQSFLPKNKNGALYQAKKRQNKQLYDVINEGPHEIFFEEDTLSDKEELIKMNPLSVPPEEDKVITRHKITLTHVQNESSL